MWRVQADRQRRGTDRHTFDLDQLGTGQQQPGRQRPPLEAGRTGVGSGVVMWSAHARSSRPGESAPGRDALQQQRRSRPPSCAPCVVTDHGRNVLSSQRSHWREGGGRITRTPRCAGRTYRGVGGSKRREKVSPLSLLPPLPPICPRLIPRLPPLCPRCCISSLILFYVVDSIGEFRDICPCWAALPPLPPAVRRQIRPVSVLGAPSQNG